MINLLAYDAWLEDLDKWRNKFSFPLSRKQACEILVDNSKYEQDDFVEPKMDTLFWFDWETFANKALED